MKFKISIVFGCCRSKGKRKRQQQQQQPNFRDSIELSELAAVHQQVEQDLVSWPGLETIFIQIQFINVNMIFL